MAADDRKRRLDKTVADIQNRFGLRAIGRPAPATHAVIPTGFAALDEALGIGGLPIGRVSEIAGAPTSGMATLALKVVAQAQSTNATAAYIDLDKTFDPDYAARCGIDLERLLLIRPYTVRQALDMLPDFATGGGFRVLVCDAPLTALAPPDAAENLARVLGRIVAPLSRSGCALLFLSALPPGSAPSLDDYPGQTALPHYAAIRLLIQRERWLYRRHDVAGYAAQVLVVKNRLAAAGRHAAITFTFNGTVRAEGLT